MGRERESGEGHFSNFKASGQLSYCFKETAWREQDREQKSLPAESEKNKNQNQDLTECAAGCRKSSLLFL